MPPEDGNPINAEPSRTDGPEALEQAVAEDGSHALINQAEMARRRTHELRGQAARLKSVAHDSLALRKTTHVDGDRPSRETVYLLREDPDLGAALSPSDRERFERLLQAPAIQVRGSTWQPPAGNHDGFYGLLVLGGLLARRLRLGDATSIELLGRGDVLRPWQDPPETAIQAHVDWRVLAPARLALLDERITRWIGLRRELTLALAARLVRRSHATAYLNAIAHVKRVEERLLAMLWHVATNWGHVTPQGVRIPFRLTHEVLGELVGAHRPSVTIGLGKLRERGDVARTEDGKLLLPGEPPVWPV
jgi:CRP/FNR family transcriptional regulator, cyclic AMP receptor protein